ncbi:hypothetical protein [Dactylosporangium sp. NPDC051484]|uniref:hypothetical protein n=1 Tax=Dactylosporangium sp. NPDC051484 TaxID=3154942 RepID=UPI00344C9038
MSLTNPTRQEARAQKRAAMYNARIKASQTPREQLGHAMDYLRAALDGADPQTVATVAGQLVTIAGQYNGRFERQRTRRPA